MGNRPEDAGNRNRAVKSFNPLKGTAPLTRGEREHLLCDKNIALAKIILVRVPS